LVVAAAAVVVVFELVDAAVVVVVETVGVRVVDRVPLVATATVDEVVAVAVEFWGTYQLVLVLVLELVVLELVLVDSAVYADPVETCTVMVVPTQLAEADPEGKEILKGFEYW
jgi:hypothetical protein